MASYQFPFENIKQNDLTDEIVISMAKSVMKALNIKHPRQSMFSNNKANAVINYLRSEQTSLNWTGLIKKLGYSYETYEEAFAKIKEIVIEHKITIVTEKVIRDLGYTILAGRMAKTLGGFRKVKEDLGMIPLQAHKPKTYEEAVSACKCIVQENNLTYISLRLLRTLGHTTLANYIQKASGGIKQMQNQLGLPNEPFKNEVLSMEESAELIKEIMDEHAMETITLREVKELGYTSLFTTLNTSHYRLSDIKKYLGVAYTTYKTQLEGCKKFISENGPRALTIANLKNNGLTTLAKKLNGELLNRIRIDLDIDTPRKIAFIEAKNWIERNGAESFSEKGFRKTGDIDLYNYFVTHRLMEELCNHFGIIRPKKSGYWKNIDNVIAELETIAQSIGLENMNSTYLQRNGYANIINVCNRHHGGFIRVAKLADVEVTPLAKQNGYWKDITNAINEIKQAASIVESENMRAGYLRENGYSALISACNQYHGGIHKVAELAGVDLNSSSARRVQNIRYLKAELESLKLEINAHGTYGLSVSQLLVILRQGFGKAGVKDINQLKDSEGGDVVNQLLSTELTPDALITSLLNGEDALTTMPKDLLDNSKSHVDFHADETNVNQSSVTDNLDVDDDIDDGIRGSDLFQPQIVDNQLLTLDAMTFLTDDAEAVEFMKRETKRELWNHAYRNEQGVNYVIKRCKELKATKPWTQVVQTELLKTIQQIQDLTLPSEFNYTVNGTLVNPTTMQRHVAVETSQLKELLVMSEMGTGKSLAAQLTVINHGCKNIIVISKNECVGQWLSDFKNQWKGINVSQLTLDEIKSESFNGDLKTNGINVIVIASHLFSYLTDEQVSWLTALAKYDGLILDEIHVFKSRDESESNRKRQVTKFLTTVKELNPDRIVLGLSGTVIVNAISEAQSLLELVTCVERPDLAQGRGLEKEQRVHQALMANGIRQRSLGVEIPTRLNQPKVDLTHLEDEIKGVLQYPSSCQLSQFERLFIEPTIPTIIEAINGPTIIATQYTTGIVGPIQRGLEEAGISYGINTGDNKEPCRSYPSAVEAFKAGAIQVLIGSVETICTGIDGFQNVCSNMIIASLPWTAANYQQLIRRIARTGQQKKEVIITIPRLFFEYFENGENRVWSYSDYRRSVIAKKQRLMDAVIDGQIASSVTEKLTQSEITEGVCKWFKRVCQDGGAIELPNRPLQVPLTFQSSTEELKARRRFGDFSRINGRWNSSSSSSLHQRLLADPQEWELYHTELESLRSGWSVDPLNEVIGYLSQSQGLTVGDFGCGTAQLAEALNGRHSVHSFDHVAYNDSVVACDVAEGVALPDRCLDVAVFCLSLMGSNWKQQLVEARRCLKDIGHLIIWNAASSAASSEMLDALQEAGFAVYESQEHDKWLYVRATAALPAFAS